MYQHPSVKRYPQPSSLTSGVLVDIPVNAEELQAAMRVLRELREAKQAEGKRGGE